MKTLLIALIFFILFPVALIGQNFSQQYEYGKELLRQSRYQAAMQVFLPITSETQGNIYFRHALYLYALAAFKATAYDDAKSALLQLLEKYPNWDQREEVNYLLANTYFELKNHRKALAILKGLSNSKEDANNMKLYYLNKIILDTLIKIQHDHPEDITIARLLAHKISSKTEKNEKEKMLLNFLIQEYKFDSKKFFIKHHSQKKDKYNVALLLPFSIAETDFKSVRRTNQYAYDFYTGAKLAIDSLNRDKKIFNLYAYDTEKSESKVKKLINSTELSSMDLIIGPVAQNEIEHVVDFSNQTEICTILPFSLNAKNIEGRETVMMCQPSLEIMAGKIAAYVYDSLRVDSTNYNPVKNIPPFQKTHVMIFYGNEIKDSVLAARFRDSVLSKGFEVKHFDKVTKNRVSFLQTIFADTSKVATAACIFVTSSDEVVVANIVSLLEVSQQNTPLITRADWLQFDLISFSQMERRRVHFIHTDYLDFTNDNYNQFKKAFMKKTNLLPSIYAVQGYEYMMYFGQALKEHGTYFYYGLQNTGKKSGIILSGWDYTNSYANLYVPITRFKNKKLELVNRLK